MLKRFRKPTNRRTTNSVQMKRRPLDVRVRRRTARNKRLRVIFSWVRTLVFLVLLTAASVYSMTLLTKKFFLNNPDYNLNHVVITSQPILTAEDAMKVANLKKGTNILKLNLEEIQHAIEKIPDVKRASIRRELPDGLKISVQLRQPLAWVAEDDTHDAPRVPEKLIAEDSTIYKPTRVLSSYYQLPAIYGVRPDAFAEGDILHTDEIKRALDLIKTLQFKPDSLLVIRSLDISKGWVFEVINDRNTHIQLRPDDFATQLDRLQILLKEAKKNGRELANINLIPKRNTPVRFVLSAAESPVKFQTPTETP
ncbi:MAG: cell division protein FtsQ/DivIB [Chthoniobacterales bacterium]